MQIVLKTKNSRAKDETFEAFVGDIGSNLAL